MGRKFSNASSLRPPMTTDHTFPLPCSACQCPLSPLLFSTTSNNQISQPLCFDNDTKYPPGVGSPCSKNTPRIGNPKGGHSLPHANAALAASDAEAQTPNGTWGVQLQQSGVHRGVGRRSMTQSHPAMESNP